LFSVKLNTYITPIILKDSQIDIEMDFPRGRLVLSSTNNSREVLAHSSIFFISYTKRIEAQSNNLSWANQLDELCVSQGFLLSYTSPKEREDNIQDKMTITNNMPNLQGESITILNNTLNLQSKGVANSNMNMCIPQDLQRSSISYKGYQPAESNF